MAKSIFHVDLEDDENNETEQELPYQDETRSSITRGEIEEDEEEKIEEEVKLKPELKPTVLTKKTETGSGLKTPILKETFEEDNSNSEEQDIFVKKFWETEQERDFDIGVHGENREFTAKISSLFDSSARITDIHVTEGKNIWIRVEGDMVPISKVVTPQGGIESLCSHLFKLPVYDKVNSSCSFKGRRLRLRFSRTMHNNQLFIRILSGRAPSLEQIGHVKTFEEIRKKIIPGIVFIAGATGSGKSTMLASLLQEYLDSMPIHLSTVEDPIEYQLFDGIGEVSQREIPDDVRNFPDAVRDVLREDPDIILVGEMRDSETARTALIAAETGHLVFTTIHAAGIPGIVDRLLGMLSGINDAPLRIASSFLGGIHLSVDKFPDGSILRRTHLLWADDKIRDLIREMKFHEMDQFKSEIINRH